MPNISNEEILLLKKCNDYEQWNTTCSKIKDNHNGYPSDWWKTVMSSGLANDIMKNFGSKEFPLEDILSVTTGLILSKDKLDFSIHEVFNYIVNDYLDGGPSLSYEEIVSLSPGITEYIFGQYPELIDVNIDNLTEENFDLWLEEQVLKYGKTLRIKAFKISNENKV